LVICIYIAKFADNGWFRNRLMLNLSLKFTKGIDLLAAIQLGLFQVSGEIWNDKDD